MSTTIPLYSVTYRRRGDIHVEILASHQAAIARRDEITADVGRVVIAEHGLRVGR